MVLHPKILTHAIILSQIITNLHQGKVQGTNINRLQLVPDEVQEDLTVVLTRTRTRVMPSPETVGTMVVAEVATINTTNLLQAEEISHPTLKMAEQEATLAAMIPTKNRSINHRKETLLVGLLITAAAEVEATLTKMPSRAATKETINISKVIIKEITMAIKVAVAIISKEVAVITKAAISLLIIMKTRLTHKYFLLSKTKEEISALTLLARSHQRWT
jgi:hypothetical protein